MREKKLFVVFTLIYTILIFLTSFFIEIALAADPKALGGARTWYSIGIFFVTALILSILYSWIIVARNRRIFATLKCIGWTNSNINSLVTGIILYTTMIGFVVVIEVLFHYAAVMTYLGAANPILIGLLPVVISFVLFLVVQVVAILLANRKVLKVRPMLALKRVEA